jgi:hypothetical protein
MITLRKGVVAVAMVASTLTGGAIGATLIGGSANAQTTTTTPSSSSSSSTAATAAPSGKFTPN